METKYTIDHDEIEGPHVQLEIRHRWTDRSMSAAGGLIGGQHWVSELRARVDGEPVTDWHPKSSKAFDVEVDRPDDVSAREAVAADGPEAVTTEALDEAFERGEKLFAEDHDWSPPWIGSSGYGHGSNTMHWLLG